MDYYSQRYMWGPSAAATIGRGGGGYTKPETAARLASSAGQQDMPVWRIETFVTLASEPSIAERLDDENSRQPAMGDSEDNRSTQA